MDIVPKITDADIIRRIQDGNAHALKDIYPSYRLAFLNWARRQFSCDDSDILDVYQDAMIIFYKNVAQGKITALQSSVKTYIFGIGRNLLLKNHAQRQRTQRLENIGEDLITGVDLNIFKKEESEHKKEMVRQLLSHLGEKCQRILILFYYHRYSIESIQKEMGYNHVDVVRSRKLKCIKQLRALVNK